MSSRRQLPSWVCWWKEGPQNRDQVARTELPHELHLGDSNLHAQLPHLLQRAESGAFCGRASPLHLRHHVSAHCIHCLGPLAHWAACTRASCLLRISPRQTRVTYGASWARRKPPWVPVRVKGGAGVGGGPSYLQLSLHCLSDLPVCYRAGRG